MSLLMLGGWTMKGKVSATRRSGRRLIIVLAAVLLAVAASGCGGSQKDPSGDEVAEIAEASSCDKTTFYVKDADGDKKHTIYNCVINGKPRCVVYVEGIARDETEAIVASFASALGADRPSCAAQN